MLDTRTYLNRDALISALLLVSMVCVYLLWPNKCFLFDSLDYAYSVREGQNLFHPHHLLYNGLGYLLYKIVSAWGIGIFDILIWLNSMVGGLIVFLSYRILRKAGTAPIFSVLCSLSIGLCGEFWRNAVTVVPWHLSLLFSALTFYLAAFHIRAGWKTILLLSLTTSLSCLFHQTGLFLIICVLPFFIKERLMLRYAVYTGTSGLICLLVYYLAVWSQGSIGQFTDIIDWTLLSTNNMDIYGYHGLRHMVHYIPVGIIRMFFPLDLFTKLFMGKEPITIMVIAALSMVFLYFIGLSLLILGLRNNLKRLSTFRLALVLWILPLAVLASLWAPNEQSEWFKITVPLFLFIGIYSDSLRRNLVIMTICLLTLFLVNFVYNIYPNSKEENYDALKVANTLLMNGVSNSDLLLGNFCPEVIPFLKLYHNIDVSIFTLSMQKKHSGEKHAEAIEAIIKRIDNRILEGSVFISDEERFPNPNKLLYMSYGHSIDDFWALYGKYQLVPLKQGIVNLRRGAINLYRLSPNSNAKTK